MIQKRSNGVVISFHFRIIVMIFFRVHLFRCGTCPCMYISSVCAYISCVNGIYLNPSDAAIRGDDLNVSLTAHSPIFGHPAYISCSSSHFRQSVTHC